MKHGLELAYVGLAGLDLAETISRIIGFYGSATSAWRVHNFHEPNAKPSGCSTGSDVSDRVDFAVLGVRLPHLRNRPCAGLDANNLVANFPVEVLGHAATVALSRALRQE